MSSALTSLREKRGTADIGRTAPIQYVELWRMSVGTIRLWIIGPGSDAMHPASDVYYHGRIGTDQEREIAQRAVDILNLTHRHKEAGADEIKAALETATHQITNGLPLRIPRSTPAAPPLPPTRQLVVAKEDDRRRIQAAVELVTGIPTATYMDKSGQFNQRGDVTRARIMALAVCQALYPDMAPRAIDRLFDLSPSTTGRALIKSHGYKEEPIYSTRFALVINKLS
jgi:hypothetical protein